MDEKITMAAKIARRHDLDNAWRQGTIGEVLRPLARHTWNQGGAKFYTFGDDSGIVVTDGGWDLVTRDGAGWSSAHEDGTPLGRRGWVFEDEDEEDE